jgi:hypothetical protein
VIEDAAKAIDVCALWDNSVSHGLIESPSNPAAAATDPS